MEEQIDKLVKKTWAKYHEIASSKRLMIAVSGIPGSGKTTLASKVVKRLNELHHENSPGLAQSEQLAVFIPMDGYHLSREQLSSMQDPDTAHARRGAAFTFDAPAFLKLVKELRQPLCPETKTLYAPSFDHALKDPVYNDIPISPELRILIFEGNYLSLGSGAPEWKEAAELMDELWFVEVDEDVAKQRLIKRHIVAGLASNEEEAAHRAENNDLVNGREIVKGRLNVHEIIVSKHDQAWKPERQGMEDAQKGPEA
ncbi:hypothetical protein AAFC00_007168 [Neodothiora populina]|uniref:Phosphoribulokinase/uridine kinase domain-containing protein n=1 Tax=Neodothiora populina TaxID=2781224 RepID=A0ABR3PHF2_9PEZI